jgi:hypothetical protein
MMFLSMVNLIFAAVLTLTISFCAALSGVISLYRTAGHGRPATRALSISAVGSTKAHFVKLLRVKAFSPIFDA